jgi:hypothetical protein
MGGILLNSIKYLKKMDGFLLIWNSINLLKNVIFLLGYLFYDFIDATIFIETQK